MMSLKPQFIGFPTHLVVKKCKDNHWPQNTHRKTFIVFIMPDPLAFSRVFRGEICVADFMHPAYGFLSGQEFENKQDQLQDYCKVFFHC